MSPQPTTSRSTSTRRSRIALAERYRVWRSRPRIASLRWYWVFLSFGVLLDAATATLAVCLLMWPESAPARGALGMASWAPAWAAAVTATVLFGLQRWLPSRWGRASRVLKVAGLAACVVVALTAGWPGTIPGPAGWTIWLAGLVVVAAMLLQVGQGRDLLALAAACTAAPGLLLASRLPGTTSILSPLQLLVDSGGIAAVRAVALAGGGAALALTWMSANLVLALVLFTPTRRGSIRLAGDAAYRALALAVTLLALAAFLGGWPLQFPRDGIFLALLAILASLLHARFAGWALDLGLALGCALLGAALLGLGGLWLAGRGAPPPALGWLAVAVLANLSLVVHALHRYCFGCGEKIAAIGRMKDEG